ncbi:hypothetical protein B0H19DRAFT_1383985 [Mycena capillaripes]|nr:hypothetical protein B0H19DRAFT_1383985 [Mycena capillaripes]
MLVTWRVKEWVEPLLFRVVLQCYPMLARLNSLPALKTNSLVAEIARKPAEFFPNSVKYMFLDATADPSSVEAILAACSQVTNLLVESKLQSEPGIQTYMPALGNLQCLQYLWIVIGALLEHPAIDVPHPAFRNVTHLGLHDSSMEETLIEDLCAHHAYIPRLTHIALNLPSHMAALYCGLDKNPALNHRLECIVFLSPQSWWNIPPDIPDAALDDDRFVCIIQETNHRVNWLNGITRDGDYWAFATAFIAYRRESEGLRRLMSIPKQYIISDGTWDFVED